MRGKEDDFVLLGEGEPGLDGAEGGGGVFYSAVGCRGGDGGLGWEVGSGWAGEGEEVDVHLGCESFGEVGWCNPAAER